MRVLIVDDEPLARRAVRTMLRPHPDVEIAGECEGGAEAIAAIQAIVPDLIFLDVQMPEVDGFAVLEAVGWRRLPHVVFVTAYDRYAVRAFEVRAVDYLLKPFDRERFDAALRNARRQFAAPDWDERIRALLHETRGCEHLQRFIVKGEGRVFFIPAADVDWIEAQGNYVNLHGLGRACLFREAMSGLEARLDPRKFRRINRSAIVNIESIHELRPRFHGDYEVILKDGRVLKLSHRYRANLENYALGRL